MEFESVEKESDAGLEDRYWMGVSGISYSETPFSSKTVPRVTPEPEALIGFRRIEDFQKTVRHCSGSGDLGDFESLQQLRADQGSVLWIDISDEAGERGICTEILRAAFTFSADDEDC